MLAPLLSRICTGVVKWRGNNGGGVQGGGGGAEVVKVILKKGSLLRHKLLVADLMDGIVEVMNLLGRDNLRQVDGSIRLNLDAVGYVDRLLPRVPSAGVLFEF